MDRRRPSRTAHQINRRMGFIWRLCPCQIGALLTEVIPAAWERERKPQRGELHWCTHKHALTHTMSLSVPGCDRPMALARYVDYVCQAIHHPCTFPPETGTFVWSTHLLSPSFDSARPNLFPYSRDRGFISTYILFFIFPSANVLETWGVLWPRGDCELQFGDQWPLSSLTRVSKQTPCCEVKLHIRKRKDLRGRGVLNFSRRICEFTSTCV